MGMFVKKEKMGVVWKEKLEEYLLKYLCIVLQVKLVKNPRMKVLFKVSFIKAGPTNQGLQEKSSTHFYPNKCLESAMNRLTTSFLSL